MGNFYGTYYGQALVDVNPDNLIYLNNDIIENCITYNYENKKANKVYDLEKYEKILFVSFFALEKELPILLPAEENTPGKD